MNKPNEMNNPIDDGGPAFPVGIAAPDGEKHLQEGMSLRDWLAGQALTGYCATRCAFTDGVDTLANWAYQQADAMLKARAAK